MPAVIPTAALFVLGANAVSFTSWVGLGCRGQQLVKNTGMYPYTCYSAGLNAASIKAAGLENSNNPSTYMELYSDPDCKDYVSTVKYSQTCQEANYQAVRLIIPPISKAAESEVEARNENVASLRLAPLESLTKDQQQIFDDELHEALLAMEKDSGESGETEQNSRRSTKPRLGMSLLPVRAVGDRHVSNTDSSLTGLETADDNVPGDSAGFQFANNNQRNTWVTTLYQRLIRDRTAHPGNELYTGAQTVGNHDLEVEVTMRSGTLGSTALALFRQWIAMFALQRDNHAHQEWELLQDGNILATITFKAYRNA